MKKLVLAAVIVAVVVGGVIAFAISRRTAAPAVQTKSYTGTYVALGDSVAAGVGLKDYSDTSACDRTQEAYPQKVADSLQYHLTSIACSGATIAQGISGAQNVNNLQTTPQLDQLFKQPEPTLVSLTIGANDIRWTDILQKCYTGTCGTPADQAQINSRLQSLSADLRKVLSSVQSHYAGSSPPIVVLTGYHQVFPTSPTAGCTDLTGIDTAELAWGRKVQSDLNNAIQAVSKDYPFTTFAAVDFSGHELCSSDPWVQSLGDPQPYHPTADGQAAFAKAVVAAARSSKGGN